MAFKSGGSWTIYQIVILQFIRILKVDIVSDIFHTFLVGSFIVSPLSPIWIVSKLVGDRISLSESAAFINMLLNKLIFRINSKKLLLQLSYLHRSSRIIFSFSNWKYFSFPNFSIRTFWIPFPIPAPSPQMYIRPFLSFIKSTKSSLYITFK